MKTPRGTMGIRPETLEVRYSPEARADFETKVVPFMRRQAIVTIVLGSVVALMMAGVVVGLFVLGEGLTAYQGMVIAAMMLILPLCVIVIGVRRYRRKFALPDVVLTITDDYLVLGRFERMTPLGYGRPELHWDRRATQAVFVAGNGTLTHDRIKFMHGDGLKRRSHNVAVATLDTSAEEILAAMQRP